MVRYYLGTCALLSFVLLSACSLGAGPRNSTKLVDFVMSVVARDWRLITANDLQKAGLRFERVETREGCDGAVFLQSVESDPDRLDRGEVTVTFEVGFTSAPARREPCLERLMVVTVSRRSDTAATASRFAEILIDRLQLEVGAHSGAVRNTVTADGAYIWSVANQTNGSLCRRDLEVRQENGRWLTRFREFRDDAP